ncbi:MAG: hypothetical protein HY822_05570 [Acidobacteria bacterium]|nr:hypothetical protein [Acidobacteriota bacterium]
MAMCAVSALAAGFLAADSRCFHWFVLPLAGCGVLVAVNAVEWLRGRVDLFDPGAVFGLYGVHFFLVAPLLHVVWDQWRPWVAGPQDWRTWLGWMALLNFAGLVAYNCARRLAARTSRSEPPRVSWRLNRTVFGRLLVLALVGAAVLQLKVYASFGGLTGYISAVSEAGKDFGLSNAFTGFGPVFMISESFPLVAWLGLLAYGRESRWLRARTGAASCLAAVFVLLMLFGGLRGSRAATVWSLFLIAGSYHCWVQPIPKRILVCGLAFLIAFMYLYGFYKAAGLDAIARFQPPWDRRGLERETGRSTGTMILGDLARSDVQALILYRLTAPESDFEPAWGRTYLGAASILVPRFLWPNKPDGKVRWTTEVEMGKQAYRAGRWISSMVAGLAGEAMLNFGLWAAPAAYALFGLFVGWTQRFARTLDAHDSRRLLLPLLLTLAIQIPVSDLDNVIFFLMKYGAVPVLVVVLSSRRVVWEESQPLVHLR